MQERGQRIIRGAGQQKWTILIGKYKGISQGRIHSKCSLLSSPGVLAALLAKASSSLTILQKKALQKLGPLSFFLMPELALNGTAERKEQGREF